jgi:hypothetical protein
MTNYHITGHGDIYERDVKVDYYKQYLSPIRLEAGSLEEAIEIGEILLQNDLDKIARGDPQIRGTRGYKMITVVEINGKEREIQGAKFIKGKTCKARVDVVFNADNPERLSIVYISEEQRRIDEEHRKHPFDIRAAIAAGCILDASGCGTAGAGIG